MFVCRLIAARDEETENIALHKPASQSGWNRNASIAVDGDLSTSSCTDTEKTVNPIWFVNLKRQTIVTHVYLTTCGKLLF